MTRGRPDYLPRLRPLAAGYLPIAAAAGVVALAALAALGAKPALGEVGGALILVLGVIVAGAVAGLVAALCAAVAAFLVYNFFFAAPVLSFHVANDRDLTPLIVFNLCAAVAGVLAGRLKDRARAADRSNHQLASLLETSRALLSAIRPADIAAVLDLAAAARPGLRVGLLDPAGGRLPASDDRVVPETWRRVAATALRSREGRAASGPAAAYRLDGGDGNHGVLVAETGPGGSAEPSFPAALATLAALAIERAHLSERVSEQRAIERTEALKTALLASVSHDFRTPLTAISASASSLIDYGDRLDAATSDRLLRGIVEECDRLNRYTANLLEMSRLEAGEALGRRQILSVSDMLGAVIQRLRPRAGNRVIERALPDGELLVAADAALFELVLVNVLDNAIRYGPDGSRIRMSSTREGRFCRIDVADEGIGVPGGDLGRIFQRFYRVDRAGASPRGTGLGLAIARAFVEALGGGIAAATPGIGDRGVRIIIHLPLAEPGGS